MVTAAVLIAQQVIISWCSACHEKTPHRYEPDGKVKLVCVVCEATSPPTLCASS